MVVNEHTGPMSMRCKAGELAAAAVMLLTQLLQSLDLSKWETLCQLWITLPWAVSAQRQSCGC